MPTLGLSLGKKLKEFRDQQGETQAWLATFLSFAQATIIKWEKHGASSATLAQVELIAEKTKILPSVLLGVENQKPAEMVTIRKAEFDALQAVLDISKEVHTGLLHKLTKSEDVSVYVSKKIWDEFRACCDKNSVSPSEVLERLMQDFVKGDLDL